MTASTASALVPDAPLLRLDAGGPPPRVAVLTGSYGAGHDSAARELEVLLRDAGCTVQVDDIVELLPWRLGPVLRTAYYAQLRQHPGSWGTTLRLLEAGRPLHHLVSRLLGAAAARVVRATRGSDLVITTHPFAAQALGRARERGLLQAPAVTYFTDTSVHALWVHRGIDLNLAIHQVAADDARQWDAAATVVAPLLPPTARYGRCVQADPLGSLGVVGPRALVTGGSLGMGDLEHSCRDILATATMTPVVLCGLDESLRRRLARIPGVGARRGGGAGPGAICAPRIIVEKRRRVHLAGGARVGDTGDHLPAAPRTRRGELRQPGAGRPRPLGAHGRGTGRPAQGSRDRRAGRPVASRGRDRPGGAHGARGGGGRRMSPQVQALPRPAVLLGAVGALGVACSPAVTALGPVRRRLTPRLAGVGDGAHVALTFDDGPDPSSTPAVLDLLAAHGRRATFFVLGAQAQAAPSVLRRMVAEGHEVAIHGWRHRCTVLSAPARLTHELRRARETVEDVAGARVRWYRPPYGVLSAEALLACRSLELQPVLWTAWGRDWERSATPERIVATTLRTLRPGGTVLLHDTDLHGRGDWRRTRDATDRLLTGPLRGTEVGPLHDHWCP